MQSVLARRERPLAEQLYPQAAQIHYAVLNGRDLPEVTRDFCRAGMDLSGLSPGLTVPLD